MLRYEAYVQPAGSDGQPIERLIRLPFAMEEGSDVRCASSGTPSLARWSIGPTGCRYPNHQRPNAEINRRCRGRGTNEWTERLMRTANW